MRKLHIYLTFCAALLAGCSEGELGLHIDNETGAAVTVAAPRGSGKVESVTVPPLGSGQLSVWRKADARITTSVGGKVVEEFEVGKVPELDTGVHDVALYLIQPAALNYDLYTADYSGLYGTSGTTGMQTAGKLSDIVKRTGTKFVRFSSRLSGIQLSFPAQPLPSHASRGKLHYRLVRVPKNVPPDKVEPYMLGLLKTNQGRQ